MRNSEKIQKVKEIEEKLVYELNVVNPAAG